MTNPLPLSEASLDALEAPSVSEPVKEPAKRWRNWWRAEKAISTQRNGDIEPGDFPGSMSFWSREDAEQQARADLARDCFYAIERGVTYLGAFPEGERPGGAG